MYAPIPTIPCLLSKVLISIHSLLFSCSPVNWTALVVIKDLWLPKSSRIRNCKQCHEFTIDTGAKCDITLNKEQHTLGFHTVCSNKLFEPCSYFFSIRPNPAVLFLFGISMFPQEVLTSKPKRAWVYLRDVAVCAGVGSNFSNAQ